MAKDLSNEKFVGYRFIYADSDDLRQNYKFFCKNKHYTLYKCDSYRLY